MVAEVIHQIAPIGRTDILRWLCALLLRIDVGTFEVNTTTAAPDSRWLVTASFPLQRPQRGSEAPMAL